MDLLISIFVAFIILICILPIGIIVQRLVMCAFKCIEKEWIFGVFLEYEFFNENSNLEYKLCKATYTSCFEVYKRTEYRCYVPSGNKDSA